MFKPPPGPRTRELVIALTPQPVIAIVLKIMRRLDPVGIRLMEGKVWSGPGA